MTVLWNNQGLEGGIKALIVSYEGGGGGGGGGICEGT